MKTVSPISALQWERNDLLGGKGDWYLVWCHKLWSPLLFKSERTRDLRALRSQSKVSGYQMGKVLRVQEGVSLMHWVRGWRFVMKTRETTTPLFGLEHFPKYVPLNIIFFDVIRNSGRKRISWSSKFRKSFILSCTWDSPCTWAY